jgi:hypothetical protein
MLPTVCRFSKSTGNTECHPPRRRGSAAQLLADTGYVGLAAANYNHDASFAQYHTYAWGSNNKNAIQNSILAQVQGDSQSTPGLQLLNAAKMMTCVKSL